MTQAAVQQIDTGIQFYDFAPPETDVLTEVLAGLKQRPKTLSPKFFYDKKGSQLFDRITRLPEYYPTRTEIGILTQYQQKIADSIHQQLGDTDSQKEIALIEYGSGNGEKIQRLMEALKPSLYVPLEISRQHLLDSVKQIRQRYNWLDIHAICVDYGNHWPLPEVLQHIPRLAFFPGSTIGNFDPKEAQRFLSRIAETVGPQGGLLIGVDLKKDERILNRAYNDDQGITAQFNLNMLHHLNHTLAADFHPEHFQHQAFYNPEKGRIEMHLECTMAHQIRLNGEVIEFARGERIHTENSYKFAIDEFHQLAANAGFRPQNVWTDPDQLFSVHFLVPASD